MRKFSESVQWKLMGLFVLILIPLVLVSLYTVGRSQSILEKQVGDRTRGAMESAIQYIDLTLQSIEEQSVLLATDDNLNRVLYSVGADIDRDSINELRKAMAQITNVTNNNRSISRISIVHADSDMLISSDYGGIRLDDSYRSSDWFKEVTAAAGRTVLYVPPDTLPPGDLIFNKDNITFMRLMDLNSAERGKHILMLSIGKDKLLDLVKKINPSKNAVWYLLAGDDRLIAATAKLAAVPLWDHDKELQVMDMPGTDEKYIMFRIKSSISKWSLMMAQPKAELYKETEQLRLFIVVIIAASGLFALVAAALFYTSLSLPLKKLLHGMTQIQIGNLNVRFKETRRDELGYLMNAFNQMATEQKHLIENIYEKNLQVAKTELKFLQSQINPHFLYNTMDSIYWMAKNYDADEISEMVLNLSKFLRLNLDKGRETMTVAETFAHLQYYIRVQQLRFMDQFEVRFALPDDCRDIQVLRLLVQPLVENAIIHGLEKRQTGGLLEITAEKNDNMLHIEVCDNGKGLPAERLKTVHHVLSSVRNGRGDAEAADKEQAAFGLRNVKARLMLYYENRADLAVESRENEWTRVTIRIPL
ncbi:cache domain-containing sensor histidine kinase [Paenibacillus thalictri]|nr:sensor histidine kinase [Paenibacillus thalictri]